MTKKTRIVVRCSYADKELLAEVAKLLRRSQSDTVRQLIHEKAGQLDLVDRFIDIPPLDDLESLVWER